MAARCRASSPFGWPSWRNHASQEALDGNLVAIFAACHSCSCDADQKASLLSGASPLMSTLALVTMPAGARHSLGAALARAVGTSRPPDTRARSRDMDTLSRDLVSHVIDMLREQALEHQEGWRRKKGDSRIFHVCEGNFTFASAGQTCKLWRELVLEAWQEHPKLLSAIALMKVHSNMELEAGVLDDDDEQREGEDEDEDEDARLGNTECALIVASSQLL